MLKITLTEPRSPRYIYINTHHTNYVHLLVPLGQEISADNTSTSTPTFDEFKSAALNELNTYKSALEFDLELLNNENPSLQKLKEDRLTQINSYINTLPSMQEKYRSAIASQMSNTSSDLSSRHNQEHQPTVVNPMFSFVTHQGFICTDFANLIDPSSDNTFFQKVRHDLEAPSKGRRQLPKTNESITASISLDMKTLLSRIKDDDQFKKLSPAIRSKCQRSPLFLLRTFLHYVAKGNQDKADELLKNNPERKQGLLNYHFTFTDYSGRTFDCTAYEYAYWAKDTHMCRMLESYMTNKTKADTAQRINKMESLDKTSNEPIGLTFRQHGRDHHSAHFDLAVLKTALKEYAQGYDDWARTNNWAAMEAAWMKIGLAQRDVPVHVINEYCYPNRTFDPCPEFKEDKLPRELTVFNPNTGKEELLFPLVISTSSGLGVDFSLTRAQGEPCVRSGSANEIGVEGVWDSSYLVGGLGGVWGVIDLAAICRLDEVRTQDLTRSQEILGSIEPEHVHGSRP